ncbi:RsmD family RNA methyltransferase [Canibacter zhoujuaniae]|uniref:RsmD family RNA methyltransferase n=1 Tax=Canibacter zhoujuaniae TaxID=2708343 RepID=UPI00141F2350|nr:RsmD family RNA methyltransferase [Canibacter zhoujuaniae]
MTRIIAGAASSLRMKVPERGTRPTSDRVREAIFSTLEAWDFVEDTRVLDLYAGSGALGLEAVSRGARECVLVEKHAGAAKIAQLNAHTVLGAVQNAGRTAHAKVCVSAVRTFLLAEPGELFDVALIDPPYDLQETELTECLELLRPHLVENAAVLVERDKRSPEPMWPAGYSLIKVKDYGETSCWWAEAVKLEE